MMHVVFVLVIHFHFFPLFNEIDKENNEGDRHTYAPHIQDKLYQHDVRYMELYSHRTYLCQHAT